MLYRLPLTAALPATTLGFAKTQQKYWVLC